MSGAADSFLLPDYRVSRYRLTLRAIDRLVLPRERVGIILRGAFGLAFRKLVCHDLGGDCRWCALSAACPYSRVFAPSPPVGAQRLRLQADIPRPFILAPDLAAPGEHAPDSFTAFDLVLIGDSAAYLPYFVVAFRGLGEQGIGPGRGRFDLHAVEAVGEVGGTVYRTGEPLVRNVSAVERPGATASAASADRATVRFLTPTSLRSGAESVAVPEFRHLAKRLRDRASATQYFYCGVPWDVDHRELGRLAERVERVSSRTGWIDVRRRSSRTGEVHALSGFVGEATYEGDLAPFLPLLRVGERINVGKAATFGNGRIAVDLVEPGELGR